MPTLPFTTPTLQSLGTCIKKTKISIVTLLVGMLLLSCAGGPKDNEVIDLVKKECLRGSNFLLEIKIEKKGGARKPEGYNITIYPVTVSYRYISEGLLYGWVAGTSVPYFEQYYEDTEWHVVTEFLIGKNQFNEWDIVDSRTLEHKEVQKHRRPASKSMEVYYSDRVIYKSELSDSIKYYAEQCDLLEQHLENLKPYVIAYDTLLKREKALMSLNAPIEELKKNRSLFAHILPEISSRIPEALRLSSLDITLTNISIKGFAPSNQLVADFMNRLEESPYIANVDLTVLEKKTIEKQEMMEFTLTAKVEINTIHGGSK